MPFNKNSNIPENPALTAAYDKRIKPDLNPFPVPNLLKEIMDHVSATMIGDTDPSFANYADCDLTEEEFIEDIKTDEPEFWLFRKLLQLEELLQQKSHAKDNMYLCTKCGYFERGMMTDTTNKPDLNRELTAAREEIERLKAEKEKNAQSAMAHIEKLMSENTHIGFANERLRQPHPTCETCQEWIKDVGCNSQISTRNGFKIVTNIYGSPIDYCSAHTELKGKG